MYGLNAAMQSNRLRIAQMLWVAKRFAGYEAIHFTYPLDFRGHVYVLQTGLSPQGDQVSKALLEFADPVPLDETGTR